MSFNFPSPAVPGQIYASPGGPVYRFDDPIWSPIPAPGSTDTSGSGVLMPGMFGAIGDGVADDKLALQAWIDSCESTGLIGFIPAGRYRSTGTLYAGRTKSLRIVGISKNAYYADDLSHASTLMFDVADGVHGLVCGAVPAARRDGISIDGLQIYRVNQEPKAGTGVGITYHGIIQGTFRNVTSQRFAIGGHVTTVNGANGVCSGCLFENVRYEHSMKIGCIVNAAIECDFRHGKFGAATGADACLKLQDGGVTSPNGNYFHDITLIADDFAPNGADYNLLDVTTGGGIWNTFTECAFENGNINNIRKVGGGAFSAINLIIDNCWFNSVVGSTIYCEDANVIIKGSRVHSASVTSPAIHVKHVSASNNFLFSMISGNHIAFQTTAGVLIEDYNSVQVSDNFMFDATLLLPCVSITGSGAQYNMIIGNRMRTNHATGTVMGHASNIARGNLLNVAPGADYGQRTIGGPTQTVGASVPIMQVLGLDAPSSSILQARYSANGGAVNYRTYKSRGTTVGARGAVVAVDEAYHHYVYADDGSADILAGEMICYIDAVSAGIVSGSWRWNTRNAAGTLATRLLVSGEGNVGINETTPDYKLDVNGSFGFTPGASVTPVDNGDVVFQLTSNTQLTIKVKGSDAIIRTANITLA